MRKKVGPFQYDFQDSMLNLVSHDAQRRARDVCLMSSNATLGVESRARKRKRVIHDVAAAASAANAGEAIPGLPNHLVVEHILRTDHDFDDGDDPADLARLRLVSHAMNDAVTATGCQLAEFESASHAAFRGCLSAVERLQRADQLHAQERQYLCHAAARGGHLEKLMLLRENNSPWNEVTCLLAADGGHLELLQWAHANDCPWDEMTFMFAALHGHLEMIQWLHANSCPWDTRMCQKAAEGGYLEVLRWLRDNGCPWDGTTCKGAALGGHLLVLQWARANGCSWDLWTCASAALGGHLEVLQWARANGCPWDERTRAFAEEEGHDAVLEWAIANGASV